MKIEVIKQLGNCSLRVEIDERGEKEALLKASFFTQKDVCGNCKGTNIVWSGRKVHSEEKKQDFIYITRKCLSCLAESQAGEYNGGAGLFWKKWEMPKYRNSGVTEGDMGLDKAVNTFNQEPPIEAYGS